MSMSIDELEQFFNSVKLPHTIQIGSYSKVTDVRKYVDAQLIRCRMYPDKELMFRPHYERLVELKELLSAPAAAN